MVTPVRQHQSPTKASKWRLKPWIWIHTGTGMSAGSPTWPPGRTFAWRWFKLPQPVSRRKPPASRRPKRRNPVAQALEWQQRLESGEVRSRAELARQLGVSGAYVTRVLGLLHLAPDTKSLILTLGDPIKGNGFGIHTLRSLLHLPVDQQITCIEERKPGLVW